MIVYSSWACTFYQLSWFGLHLFYSFFFLTMLLEHSRKLVVFTTLTGVFWQEPEGENVWEKESVEWRWMGHLGRLGPPKVLYPVKSTALYRLIHVVASQRHVWSPSNYYYKIRQGTGLPQVTTTLIQRHLCLLGDCGRCLRCLDWFNGRERWLEQGYG